MRWLIIEDSLENHRGHWFEYLEGFFRELPKHGDEVTLLVSHRAEGFIREQLDAKPILPESAFSKMSDGASAWKRYARIPVHAWKTFWAVRKYLKSVVAPDVIFIPTVIVHHLLGWTALVKLKILPQGSRLLLFFPNLPIRKKNDLITLDGSPTSKLLHLLLKALESEVRNGMVILGVETDAMKEAASAVFGVPFTYFPHPVTPVSSDSSSFQLPTPLTMACYGPARHEKGSDLLAKAMVSYLEKHPEGETRFVLQWMEDFIGADGETIRLHDFLKQNPRVEIVDWFFNEGEYAKRLAATQVLLLPYRCSSYGLRVSRVVIEAMGNGIPVVGTRGTTLAQQAQSHGAAVFCEDESIESLVSAIEDMERNYESLAAKAREQQEGARLHFSVQKFRHTISSIKKDVQPAIPSHK